MIREVLRYPDRRLKERCAPVGDPGPAALRLAGDLVETARSFPRTVGIAAPQIGEMWRMAWVDCTGHRKAPDAQGPLWLIDPVVLEADGEEIGREGCLSLPDITANVRRATRVTVEATGLDGARRRIESAGFEARAILHEIDHLDGVLILDRVASLTLDVFPRRR
ncbi:peptide deformylase [Miltoncostaea marina]|uniref:peptide deformylase n=1 Tax=Miltoncostaea marina TaxID=2843215 RepID=UPI001C3D7B29|nr:peptide deformylase [Miltoncostaea marina]